MTKQITIELTTMAHGGSALGRHEGRAVFVSYAIPGETVRAEITEDKGRYAFARTVEVLEPSPDRVEPPCPYFGPLKCGGCQWQHIAYPAQRRFKREVLIDQLTRIGKLEDPVVQPTIAAPSEWEYRNRAKFHPAPNGELGFRSETGDRVVPIDVCLIVHPLLLELYRSLDLAMEDLKHLSLRVGTQTEDRMLIFEMEEDLPPAIEVDVAVSCVILLSDGVHANLIGDNVITEIVGGQTYRISAPAFFQVNTAQAETLVDQALTLLDPQPDEVVLDAFCGVGLFTTHLAERAATVIGIEENHAAVEDLLENTADYENVEVIEGPAEAALPDLDIPIDAALVDPPRGGVDRFALDALLQRKPGRIVYVSCDPATLARDIKRMASSGYHPVKIQPVDMFPQTYHIESVTLLERR